MLTEPISRDLAAARVAFSSGDLQASRSAHDRARSNSSGQPLLASTSAASSSSSASAPPGGSAPPTTSGESAHKAFTDWFQTPYIKSVVHGALDGASWLLIAVSLAAGALLSAPLALTVAVCAIIGGALNAGATEWQTAKGELEFAIAEKRREQWEFDNYEEGEIQEMVELYQSKGFSEHDAAAIIHTMARNGEFFVNHMMVEELGLLPPNSSLQPWRGGAARAAAFACAGLLSAAPLWVMRDSAVAVRAQLAIAGGVAVALTACVGLVQGRLANTDECGELVRFAAAPSLRALTTAAVTYAFARALV